LAGPWPEMRRSGASIVDQLQMVECARACVCVLSAQVERSIGLPTLYVEQGDARQEKRRFADVPSEAKVNDDEEIDTQGDNDKKARQTCRQLRFVEWPVTSGQVAAPTCSPRQRQKRRILLTRRRSQAAAHRRFWPV
jgi:hypothetical protein